MANSLLELADASWVFPSEGFRDGPVLTITSQRCWNFRDLDCSRIEIAVFAHSLPSSPPHSSSSKQSGSSQQAVGSASSTTNGTAKPALTLTVDVVGHDVETQTHFTDVLFNANRTAAVLISATSVATFTLPTKVAGLRNIGPRSRPSPADADARRENEALKGFVVCRVEEASEMLQRVRWVPHAEGHIALLTAATLDNMKESKFRIFNLGAAARERRRGTPSPELSHVFQDSVVDFVFTGCEQAAHSPLWLEVGAVFLSANGRLTLTQCLCSSLLLRSRLWDQVEKFADTHSPLFTGDDCGAQLIGSADAVYLRVNPTEAAQHFAATTKELCAATTTFSRDRNDKRASPSRSNRADGFSRLFLVTSEPLPVLAVLTAAGELLLRTFDANASGLPIERISLLPKFFGSPNLSSGPSRPPKVDFATARLQRHSRDQFHVVLDEGVFLIHTRWLAELGQGAWKATTPSRVDLLARCSPAHFLPAAALRGMQGGEGTEQDAGLIVAYAVLSEHKAMVMFESGRKEVVELPSSRGRTAGGSSSRIGKKSAGAASSRTTPSTRKSAATNTEWGNELLKNLLVPPRGCLTNLAISGDHPDSSDFHNTVLSGIASTRRDFLLPLLKKRKFIQNHVENLKKQTDSDSDKLEVLDQNLEGSSEGSCGDRQLHLLQQVQQIRERQSELKNLIGKIFDLLESRDEAVLCGEVEEGVEAMTAVVAEVAETVAKQLLGGEVELQRGEEPGEFVLEQEGTTLGDR